MRLFIACEIPENVRGDLVTFQNNIGDEHANIKWVEKENLHLTLKFLGEVDDKKADEIKDSINGIKSRTIGAHVSGFGVFPTESYIRVLWVSLEPSGELKSLHDAIDERLVGLGFKPEKRFTSHITLGRVRSVNDKGMLISKVNDMKVITGKIGKRFTIDRFVLKKSTLTPQGPLYEDVACVDLA